MTLRWPIVAAALLVTGSAVADTPPSRWDRARDPEAAAAFDLHRAIAPMLARSRNEATSVVEFERMRAIEYERARAMLERAGAATSKNPLLRFDLGFVYLLLQNHPRAAEVLKGALAEFPDHPAAPQGWLRLAFACGHIGDHVCEEKSYVEVLRLETEDALRLTPTLNLAETRMHLGDLNAAIDGYREALRLAGRFPSREEAPLAAWGLAVALDRAGDGMGAEREARFAIELERSAGLSNLLRDTSYVFFVPEYEIHWYEGLGAAAIARQSTSLRARAAWWREAEKSFGEYVRAGERKKDRWLPIAKARLAQAARERERSAKAAEKEPVPATEKDVDL